MTVNKHLTVCRSKASGYHVHGCRFSGSVRTEETVYFPRFNREVQMIYDGMIAVFFGKVSYLYQRDFLLIIEFFCELYLHHFNLSYICDCFVIEV